MSIFLQHNDTVVVSDSLSPSGLDEAELWASGTMLKLVVLPY